MPPVGMDDTVTHENTVSLQCFGVVNYKTQAKSVRGNWNSVDRLANGVAVEVC